MGKKQKIMNYIDSIDDPEKLDLILRLFESVMKEKNTVQSPSKA